MKSVMRLVFVGVAFFTFALSAQAQSSAHEKVKRHFQSGAEPTTKDAVWTQDDIFKVGVLNDGSRRDGYASYVCEVLYDYGFRGAKIQVQVIDIQKLVSEGSWDRLGRAYCR